MAGYPIAAEALDLEVYLLACTITASRKLRAKDQRHPNLQRLARTFELSEVTRRLVALAVVVRSMDEGRHRADFRKMVVGTLVPDETRPRRSEPLKLREACNKIIHAKDFNFYPGLEDIEEDTPLRPRVELWGSRWDKGEEFRWTARIRLWEFLDAAAAVL